MIRVTVKVCRPQATDKVGLTLYSTDDLQALYQFDVADSTELRIRLGDYEHYEGAIVYLNDTEAGPVYAAADNYEYNEEMFK